MKLQKILVFAILFSFLLAAPALARPYDTSSGQTIDPFAPDQTFGNGDSPVLLIVIEWYGRAGTVVNAIPPTDNSMSNPDYGLLSYHWYSTISYYVNPTNAYSFPTSNVVQTVTTSASAWDNETSKQVFSYRGTTAKIAGRRDGYNVISWGTYSQANAIAVTFIWARGRRAIETDCLMNVNFAWSINGEAGKMDVQNIMTHEFGHWVGLKDLYSDADYWLTMYGYAKSGETNKRTLGLGDILGLRAVYGT